MTGRIHGFLAGALLTGSITYFTSKEFSNNKNKISASLHDSINLIENNQNEITIGSNKISYIDKDVIESSKDIWNYEVIKGVNWLYSLNLASIGGKVIDSLFK